MMRPDGYGYENPNFKRSKSKLDVDTTVKEVNDVNTDSTARKVIIQSIVGWRWTSQKFK